MCSKADRLQLQSWIKLLLRASELQKCPTLYLNVGLDLHEIDRYHNMFKNSNTIHQSEGHYFEVAYMKMLC